MAHLLFFSGSTRKDSLNKKLAQAAARRAQEKGAQAEFIDLADYDMPMYNGDLEDEKGVTPNGQKLREKMVKADGFFFASPEYNSSIPPVLKNMIDWTSRPDGDVAGLVAYQGKVIALSAASPGALGGLRALVHVRDIFGNIGSHVIPTQYAMGGAMEGFHDDGSLARDKDSKMLDNVLDEFIDTAKKLKD